MRSSLRRAVTSAAVIALAALAAAPGGAAARLPATGIPFLVPNDEIGGARLGGRIIKAKQGWGAGGRCEAYMCTYRDDRRPELGYGQFSFEDGIRGSVTIVIVGLGFRGEKPVFRSPLTTFRSPKLISLGSSRRAVAKAYPGAHPGSTRYGELTYLLLRGRKGYTTTFEFYKSRLVRVLMMDGRPRG